MWGDEHELGPRAKGPIDYFLNDGSGPNVWIWVERLVEWKKTPRCGSCEGLGQPPLPRSTIEVISKTFPISNTQGSTGDQFPSRPKWHLPSSSHRNMPWRDKNYWGSHLRINEMFLANLFHIKYWLTSLNSENTPNSYFMMKEW